MEVLKFLQQSVIVYQSTRRYIPEDFNLDEISLLTTAFLWRTSLAVGLTNRGHTPAYTSISWVLLPNLRHPFLICPDLTATFQTWFLFIVITLYFCLQWLNFVQWHHIFVYLQYGTHFMSSFWRLEFWGGSYFLGNLCTPVHNIRLPFLVMMPFILCGPKREEIIGDWRIKHNEELRKLYSPNIVQLFKSRSMRWPEQWRVWRRG